MSLQQRSQRPTPRISNRYVLCIQHDHNNLSVTEEFNRTSVHQISVVQPLVVGRVEGDEAGRLLAEFER